MRDRQSPERDRILDSAQRRLRLFNTTGDPELVRSPKAHEDARALHGLIAANGEDVEAAHQLGWLLFHQEQALPWDCERTPDALAAVVRLLVPCLLAGDTDLPGEPDLARRIGDAAEIVVIPRLERTVVSSDPALLDTVIDQCGHIVEVTPPRHPGLPRRLANLAVALELRFEREATHDDLAAAVDAFRTAVDMTRPDEPDLWLRLSGLAGALRNRYEQYGDLADLDGAIAAMRRAVASLSPGNPRRPGLLSNLGITVWLRFQRGADPADLDAAVTVSRQAVEATAPDDPRRGFRLANFAEKLLGRHLRFQGMQDLAAATVALRESLGTIPADHPERWAVQTALGYALSLRAHRTGDPGAFDEAVAAQRAAVRLVPVGHIGRSRALLHLGIALHNRLLSRLSAGEPAADWDTVIATFRAAVDALPADHTQRAICLSNLAVALHNRARSANVTPADLDEAVGAAREAVAATSPGHSERGLRLVTLGGALWTRFLQTARPADRVDAISAYWQAATDEAAAPTFRVSAARRCAGFLAEAGDVRASELLQTAVELLPVVAPRHLERPDQQYLLGEFAGLAADAAAWVLVQGDHQDRTVRALQLLETGRGVLLSQSLDTRSDLTELRAKHPGLAARFVALREALDVPHQDSALMPLADGPGVLGGVTSRPRDVVVRDFAAVLDEIRGVSDEFASFGLPPAPRELLRGAEQGPVVVVNVSRYGSSALLLTTGGVSAVALPRLRHAALESAVNTFQQALGEAASHADGGRRREAQRQLSEVLAWLWDVVAEPVLLRLGYDREPAPGAAWPRVWWVAGGLLGLLPLHAAGHHGTRTEPDPLRRAVIDRVVSSYAPTVRALRHAQQRGCAPPAPAEHHRALIVAMPTTPGLPDRELAHVEGEREMLCERLPKHTLLESGVSGALTPTRDRALAHLPDCRVAHFACHGESDPADPSRSRLLLHDHATAPLTVASLAPLHMDTVQLAFLSACRTAAIETTELLDEAIHLSSAFQLAGFPHVVGTLWEAADDMAVEIASAFYSGLMTEQNTLDFGSCAHALHAATRTLRSRTRLSPSLWAAHLHVGV
jgi:hypothetical protein